MRVISKQNNIRGFTLIETILAAVILCAGVLALGAISTRSLTATRLNRQFETAASLAQKHLVLIDYIGIEDFIESGKTEGSFDNYQPPYYWQVTTKSLDINNLYHVKLTISWVERNRPYEISIDTRLNGTGVSVEAIE